MYGFQWFQGVSWGFKPSENNSVKPLETLGVSSKIRVHRGCLKHLKRGETP